VADLPSEEIAALRALVPQAAAELQRAREAWAVERAALEASLLEAQLEIRALRGEPEGAVVEGWVCRPTFWQCGDTHFAWPDGTWTADGKTPFRRAPSVREAMRAADRWTP